MQPKCWHWFGPCLNEKHECHEMGGLTLAREDQRGRICCLIIRTSAGLLSAHGSLYTVTTTNQSVLAGNCTNQNNMRANPEA
jgi:hypothetical protein